MKGLELVEPISSGQFFWMTMASVVAGGVYVWPQYLVAQTGSNGIYAIAAMMAVVLGVNRVQCWWARASNAPTFAEAQRANWGGWAWGAVGVSTLLGLVLDATLLALFGSLLHKFFYPRTPKWILTAIVAATVVWTAGRSLAVVARIVQFWFPLILLSVFGLLAMTAGDWRMPESIWPAGTVVVTSEARAALSLWFLFANGGMLLTLIPHVDWHQARQPARVALAAVGAQGIILMLLLSMCLAVLGAYAVRQLQWPILYIFSLVAVHTFFVQGVGLLVIIVWTVALVLNLTLHSFWSAANLESLGAVSSRWHPVIVGLAVASIWAGSTQVTSNLEARLVLFRWFNPLDFAWTLLLTGVGALCAWRRVRAGKTP